MSDYTDLVEYLREMHDVMLYDDSIESGIPEEMITDIDAIACKDAADAIEQLVKERDAERVRHGHWDAHHHREREEYIQGHGYEVCEWDNYSCSYCGKQSVGNSKHNYCPNCGARMDNCEE